MRILPGLLALVTTASALAAPAASKHAMMAPTSDPKTFHVRSQGGDQVYHFEIPTAPAPAAGTTATGPVSQQQASLAALFWAKSFYTATNLTVDSIAYENAPNPHYFAHLTGEVGGSRQPLYAAVLPDGKIVRPMAGPGADERAPMKKTMPGKHHHGMMKKGA